MKLMKDRDIRSVEIDQTESLKAASSVAGFGSQAAAVTLLSTFGKSFRALP
jgi:hypothetical protein